VAQVPGHEIAGRGFRTDTEFSALRKDLGDQRHETLCNCPAGDDQFAEIRDLVVDGFGRARPLTEGLHRHRKPLTQVRNHPGRSSCAIEQVVRYDEHREAEFRPRGALLGDNLVPTS
jgi:hypothetical protein